MLDRNTNDLLRGWLSLAAASSLAILALAL